MNAERRTRRWVKGVVAVVMTAGLLAVPSAADAGKNNQLSGVGKFVETCAGEYSGMNESLFTLQLEGSLEGCWFTTSIPFASATPSGVYQERGTELFDGCLMIDGAEEACGTFTTTYHFTAKYEVGEDGELLFDQEIRGRCQHPIVEGSGTGGFEGAKGRIDFKDDVANGCFDLRGHVTIVG